MNNEELRLEIVKTVFVHGSQATKDNPIAKCDQLFDWVINKNEQAKPTGTATAKKPTGSVKKTTSRTTAKSTK